jgi:hypothetical protein
MQKMFRSLNSLMLHFRNKRSEKGGETRSRLREGPSREDVIHGFRLILGREIEDQDVIDAHMRVSNVDELRRLLINSEEFREKYKLMHPDTFDHPSVTVGRDTLVFVHLRKTGGISLRNMLEAQFPADRRCPVRENQLHLLSVAELGHYDFFSGHFDQASIRLIPRNKIKTVALFREPRARLISLYRFLRAHPISAEFGSDLLVRFANELSAEEFFERPEVRSSAAVYNNYLIAFGGTYSWFVRNQSALSRDDFAGALEEAKRQIHALTALGITERFDQSAKYIFTALSLNPPRPIDALNVSDNLSKMDHRLRRVEAVTITPRLNAALEELTGYDDELYVFAVEEFERRCAEASDL